MVIVAMFLKPETRLLKILRLTLLHVQHNSLSTPKESMQYFLLKQIVPGFQSEASAKYNFCAQHLRLHAPAFATHLL